MELIIIKTSNSQPVKKFLQQKHINFEIYQEPKLNWKTQEKKLLQEWENLSDEELIKEWESLDDSHFEN